jgi:hypothetical protein
MSQTWRVVVRTHGSRHAMTLLGGASAALLLLACSSGSRDAATSDTSAAQAASAPPAGSVGTPGTDSASRSGRATVRGRVAALSDTALTVTTDAGDTHVTLVAPVAVYTRAPATLADVQPNTFVGVTSVQDPDGSQHATEIHIFPEALRGMGEGSYPMRQTGSASASRSTMTNGSVTADGSSPRMTNGAARVQPGGAITVQYTGGSQAIKVPAGVQITKIVPTNQKLATGRNVVVVATRDSAGLLRSSAIFLVPDSTGSH